MAWESVETGETEGILLPKHGICSMEGSSAALFPHELEGNA